MILSEQTKGVWALILVTFSFGVVALLFRYLGEQISLFQQLYLTFGAAFFFSMFFLKNTLSISRISAIPQRDWLVIVSRVILGSILAAALYRESLLLTKIGNVAFLQSVPFAALLGWLFFGERLSTKKVFWWCAAGVGVFLITITDLSALARPGVGELLSLISGLLFTVAFVARKWQTEFLSDKEMTQLQLFAGALFSFALSFFVGEGLPAFFGDPSTVAAVLATGLVIAFNAYLLNYGFHRVTTTLAGNILTLEAVFATLLAYLFYGEILSLQGFLGGILIIVSTVAMNDAERDQVIR